MESYKERMIKLKIPFCPWPAEVLRGSVPAAGPSEELQSFLDQEMKVSDLVNELNDCMWPKSDLAWLVANKKGKVRTWAAKELKARNELPND